MNTDNFIVPVKTDDIYKYIAQDVETKFDTLHFDIDRSLPNRKSKQVIGIKKNELGGHIMKEFVRLRTKIYSYLKDNNDEDKTAKGTKKCVIKNP